MTALAPIVGRLAQGSSDVALGSPSRVLRRGAGLLRRSLTRLGDPIVGIDVEGFRLRAPLSHQLPHYRRYYSRYALNVGALAELVSERDAATMVDVGANIGDTAAIARSRAPGLPILCIEGDPRFARLLHENTADWPEVEVIAPCLLADVSGELPAAIRSSEGTGSVDFTAATTTAVSTLDDVLAEHPRFGDPSLIKSDTDGFEARVLAGAAKTLERARPVLFLEYDQESLTACQADGLELLQTLRRHAYGPVVVYDNFGDALCLTDLGNVRLLEDLHRYAARRPHFYLDLAVFPPDRAHDAEELYRRETA